MTIISYAQNFEDVILWRALSHIEKGFYIDVGANDPLIDSVTRAFYERGWRGINIEPLSVHFADLQRERPRDINLRCAAGPSMGAIEIWECDVRGWASVDKVVIEKHTAMGNVGRYHQVPMARLEEICEQNAPQEIHFLKIDVEGFERSVLEGMDFQHFRPWIVVVEATRPNSTEEAHHQWEDLLVSANYIFIYADGLNRFYLAREHEELAVAFKYPPNVFDDFVLNAQHKAEVRATEAEAKVERAEAKAEQAEAKVEQAEAKAEQAEAKVEQAEAKARQAEVKARQAEAGLHAVYTSRSWRITEPLRWLMLQLHLLREHGLRARFMAFFKKMASPVLRRLIAFVDAHCGLRKFCVRILKMLGIKESLRRIYCRMKAHDHFRDSFRGSTFQRNRKFGTGTLALLPGTISVDELLKRVKQELEDVRKNGASD